MATLKSRIKGFYKRRIDIGKKVHCQLEPENRHSENTVAVKAEGDVVGHITDLLVHALAPEISCGNIVSVEAVVIDEARNSPVGTGY